LHVKNYPGTLYSWGFQATEFDDVYRLRLILLCCCVSQLAVAPAYPSSDVVERAAPLVEVQAWARATPPGATTGAIYGSFSNMGVTQVRVLSVEFEGADMAMIHQTLSRDGVMSMRHAEINIPAGSTVELEPGKLHIMLMKLARPLVQGCEYLFTINWDSGARTEHVMHAGSFGQSKRPVGEARTCP